MGCGDLQRTEFSDTTILIRTDSACGLGQLDHRPSKPSDVICQVLHHPSSFHIQKPYLNHAIYQTQSNPSPGSLGLTTARLTRLELDRKCAKSKTGIGKIDPITPLGSAASLAELIGVVLANPRFDVFPHLHSHLAACIGLVLRDQPRSHRKRQHFVFFATCPTSG